MATKNLNISLDEKEYKKAAKNKGKLTWKEYIINGGNKK